MQRLLFESSPLFILLCAIAAWGYAYLLYRSKHSWSAKANKLLFGLRAVLVFLLAVLLLGPVIKWMQHEYEKPSWVFLIDNSSSVGEAIDSTQQKRLEESLRKTQQQLEDQGYEVSWQNLQGDAIQSLNFSGASSDLNRGIQHILNEYEGKNLAGIALLSDGIYNSGASPAYTPVNIPIHTLGVGDTTLRIDLVLKNIAYNKVAYQGNQFPVRAQVLLQGIANEEVTVSIRKDGKVLSTLQKNAGTKSLLDFDFQLEAKEKGIQRYDVTVTPISRETNLRNNSASVFIEVVEGRKKIVMIAPAPHPDIKVFKAIVEKNSNYEFIVHIPGIAEADPALLRPGGAELFIFHQVLDQRGKTTSLFQTLYKSNSSILLMIGSATNLPQLPAQDVPLQFDAVGQWDDVTPSANSAFRDFTFSDNSNGVFARYPPVDVPFGKFSYPASTQVLLYQRIGSIITERPMLMSWNDNNRKIAVMIGEGVWRWRLSEFADNGNTEVFDELYSKLIQYLSTLEDRRKFRSFPLQNEFSDSEPVVIESQVYNELFELVYGNTIRLEIRDENGAVTNFSYTTGIGSMRYRIGALKEGVYQFKASTDLQGKTETVSGQFLVKAQNMEAQNLTADFGLLRKLATESGGSFFAASNMNQLPRQMKDTPVQSLLHTDETFNQLINLKWVFFLLLALISTEWFVRKYLGGY